MNGDGNGWASGPEGLRLWGRFGAAGLFLVAPHHRSLLMQHRALWTNAGGTWALPGGAMDSHESPQEAALREAVEETAINPDDVHVLGSTVSSGPFDGGWSYTTVIAFTDGSEIATEANEESLELRWVPFDEVESLPLLPAFAQSYPGLRRKAEEYLLQR